MACSYADSNPIRGNWSRIVSRKCFWDGTSAIGQYFNLSLVTVPGVFAKVTRPSFLLVFKVVNGMVARRNNMAAVTSYKTYIARGEGFNTLGQLFEQSLASVKQNPVLSHFQFAERFYENTIYCKTVS